MTQFIGAYRYHFTSIAASNIEWCRFLTGNSDSLPINIGKFMGHLIYNGWPCICGSQGSFYHGNGSILALWEWLNDEKQLFRWKLSYFNNHSYSVINFNHVKLRCTEPCNFLTKRALVSQQSTLVVAKDPNISHYLNLSVYLPTIILAII